MDEKKKLVVLITSGLSDERSSVAWSMAKGGVASGLDVTIFLASSGVDFARKGKADHVHLNPFDPPIKELMDGVLDAGCKVLVCPPCAKVRDYGEDDLIDGAVLVGSGAMHDLIKQGAATVCF